MRSECILVLMLQRVCDLETIRPLVKKGRDLVHTSLGSELYRSDRRGFAACLWEGRSRIMPGVRRPA